MIHQDIKQNKDSDATIEYFSREHLPFAVSEFCLCDSSLSSPNPISLPLLSEVSQPLWMEMPGTPCIHGR